MRAFGRDPIRGGHYGQRSCEPHLKAEHMAAPTNAAKREKSSCQPGAVHTWHIASVRQRSDLSRVGYRPEVARPRQNGANDPHAAIGHSPNILPSTGYSAFPFFLSGTIPDPPHHGQDGLFL